MALSENTKREIEESLREDHGMSDADIRNWWATQSGGPQTATARVLEAAEDSPTEVFAAPLDPNNPLWDTEADYQNAIRTTAGMEDPLGAYVTSAAQQDQWEREQYEKQKQLEQDIAFGGAGNLAAAGATADAWNAAIVGNYADKWNTDLGREIDYGEYVGDAASDPNAAAWQYGAMAEYANRAQGGLTPVERAEMEMNRLIQERDLRSQREAQMRDLQMRGASSSGLEIAQMLGAQQGTAERRMLGDLVQEANAQQRADRALDAGSSLASDIRGQSFGESSFNKNLKSQYQNQNARFKQDESRRRMEGEGAVAGAASAAVADQYKHQTAPTYFGADILTGNPASQPTNSELGDAFKTVQGVEEAHKAADELDDDTFFKLGPFEI